MSNLVTPHETKAEAYFCPACGAPVEIPTVLFGGPTPTVCTACGWEGNHTQLAVSSFKHGFLDDTAIAEAMMLDLRGILSKTAAQTYGRFLLKWGFMDQPASAVQLGAYIAEIAKATVSAIIQTRKKIIEEKTRERIGRSEPQ